MNRNLCFSLTILSILLASFSHCSHATEKPLWEVGIGFGSINQPYYIGTKQKRTVSFPTILPVYRGKIFKADDQGMRAEFVKGRYKFDVSGDFNFAVNSEEIELREGMDDIANILQIGPSLEITLQKDTRNKWFVNLPVRIATAFDDGGTESAGATFNPGLGYQRFFSINQTPWRFGLSTSVIYGTAEYHDIYYGVDPAFATSERPAYKTESGFSGYRLQSALASKNSKRVIVMFMRYDNISDAVFNDSPLVETDDSLAFGFIYSHYIFKSKRMVDR